MQLKQRFNGLPEREQKLLIFAGLTLLVFLFYVLVWQPLDASIAQQQTRLTSQQSLLTELRANANKIVQLRQSGASTPQRFSGSLTQLANQTATQNSISIARMQPRGEQLQVWVEQAEFNALLNWLRQLEERGVAIADLDIAETSQAGMVKVRSLTLGNK
ncbi:type II secretion system protein GspM [Bowmanella sp. JS7-9]|uniref:Type II secretion system protein M n=1 Tax=Pseudobowmanella zhangzhouensis TaxID=1537679 RepID=A0ABW1XEI5_9ALTE|nr:type II secretion system protein M [Bowmanella sp. JS7-9]TBX20901.1 general secretion pathway protein GspM [Bowmanella sp. JS7-9]